MIVAVAGAGLIALIASNALLTRRRRHHYQALALERAT
jgi:hypothetical protein